jgi:hypothetical protein
MLSCCFILIYVPFTTRSWTFGINSYQYDTYFFGHWKYYNNTEIISSGGSSTLDNFQVVSPVFIIAGMVLSVILIPTLGFFYGSFEKEQGNSKRILGILITLSGLVGFIGVLLHMPFISYLKSVAVETQFGFGFAFALILFIVIILAGIAVLAIPQRRRILSENVN